MSGPPPPVPAAAGTGERLTELVRTHYDFVWRLLRRTGVPHAEAEDAAQHVFLVAHRRIDAVALGSERAFLAGVAVRVAADVRRTRRRKPAAVESEPDAADERPGPDELTEEHRARKLLDRLLAAMPEELAAAFVLFEIEELSTREIASALGIPKGTVASRLRRAREWFGETVARERNERRAARAARSSASKARDVGREARGGRSGGRRAPAAAEPIVAVAPTGNDTRSRTTRNARRRARAARASPRRARRGRHGRGGARAVTLHRTLPSRRARRRSVGVAHRARAVSGRRGARRHAFGRVPRDSLGRSSRGAGASDARSCARRTMNGVIRT